MGVTIIITTIALVTIAAWLGVRHYPSAVLYAVLLIPAYLIHLRLLGLPTNSWELVVAAVALSGALQPAVRHAWRSAAGRLPRRLAAAALVFVAAAIISTIRSSQPAVSLGILKGWVLFPLLLGYLSAAELWQHSSFRQHVLAALITPALVVAIIGISQLPASQRVYSLYDVPNSLALWLAPLTAVLLWQGIERPRVLGSAAVLFIALTATRSLAGWLAPLLAVIVLSFWFRKSRRRALILGVLLAVATAVVTRDRLTYFAGSLQENRTSLTVRLQLWSIGWELAKENPLFGLGLGQFEPAYQQELHERFARYEPARQNGGHATAVPLPEFVFRDPHNWPLSFWLNTGLLGLVSFTVLNALILRSLSRRLPSTRLAAAAALTTLLLHGLVDTVYWKNDLAALYWIVITLAAAT